jgi:integrase
LADLIDRYVREVLPTKKAKTQLHQAGQLVWWKGKIGDRQLSDCTPALIAEYREVLGREPIKSRATDPRRAGPARYRSAATVNRYLAVLSHAFTVAVKEWGWIDSNPLLKVTKSKEPRGRVRYLSDDERNILLEVCEKSSNRDLYPAVVLALSTGARQAEIMGLHWNNIDLPKGSALLEETKNGERRTIPISGLALDLLRDRAKVRRIDSTLVFPSKDPGKPVSLRAPWEAALREAGIKDFRWHDLRHTAASYLAMNGASLNEIAEILGHKTLNMVQRYAHLSDEHTAGVVARMNAKIFTGK